jgi:hypothetical protein
MKFLFGALILLVTTFAVAQATSELSTPPNGDNERAEASQWIGPVRISIEYHSPHVHNPAANDRTGHIWGEMLHYGFFDEGFGRPRGRHGAPEPTRAPVLRFLRM